MGPQQSTLSSDQALGSGTHPYKYNIFQIKDFKLIEHSLNK